MNYVRHLNAFVKHSQLYPDWDPFLMSLYYVLFHVWNYKQFKAVFTVSREVLMRASRIGSKTKYYTCLKQLHQAGMIIYYPADKLKKMATISMVELFEPAVKATAPYPKEENHVASMVENDAGSVPDPGQVCPINGTGCVPDMGQVCPTNGTGCVPDMVLPGGKNATHSVPDIGHSLKEEKLIKDLKSVCVNRRPPMDNNNFSFFSSPGTACLPPGSLQEVKDYFLQQGYPLLEATNFFDYYAVTGWKTRSGGAPVVNWQCAARRWMVTAASQQRIAINTLKHGADQHLHTTRNKDYSKPL